MSTPELPFPIRSQASPTDETRRRFRTKIVATRLTPGELAEVEATAESAGQSLAEWLRQTALQAARQRPADPIELLLAEVWALRYTLLNLFHSNAKAAEGTQLLPDSIVKIRDQAARRMKLAQNERSHCFAVVSVEHQGAAVTSTQRVRPGTTESTSTPRFELRFRILDLSPENGFRWVIENGVRRPC